MKELTLEITNKCHQNCPWCSSSSSSDGRHVSYQRILPLLDKYRQDCDRVRISGGEPLLHPNLLSILKHAKDLNYQVILLTAGGSLQEVIKSSLVDKYVVSVTSKYTFEGVNILRGMGEFVSLEVVLDSSNGLNVARAIQYGIENKIPVRLLVLQIQGRAKVLHRKPLDLISWTGDKGCDKENKIAVTHDGKIVTCSALKYGECSLR